MDVFFSATVALLLIILNSLFAMSELALISAKRSVLQGHIDGSDQDKAAKAAKVMSLAADSDRLLATIQVAITLLSLGASAVSAVSFSVPLASWLDSLGWPWITVVSRPISMVGIILIVSYVSLISELVPKRIALANAEATAMRVVGMILMTERVARPLVRLLTASTNLIARLFGIKSPVDRQSVSEDEIKFLVAEQADLLEEEKRMIHEIIDFGDTVAREVMTPRVDMICIEEDATIASTISRMRGTGLSRLPVIVDSPDRIIGITMIKDLLAPLADSRFEDIVSNYMREPFFVPETKGILPLLGEMQASHQQIAIVVDEYGGTAGIITIEDIIEEIVGEITDEYDPEHKYKTQLSETEWMVDGRLSADEARELGFPVEENDDYETIAGWLFDAIGSVPQVGEVFEIGGFSFKVQSMRRNRISYLRVTKQLE